MPEARYEYPFDRGAEARHSLALVRALAERELRSRYRRSLLGPAWAILQPLLYMLIFVFIRQILNLSSGTRDDVLFTYSALVPWTFFSNAVLRCGPSVYNNAGIVKKIRISREVFPLAGVVSSLVDLLMAGAVLALMLALWSDAAPGRHLLWLPLLLLLTAMLALGVGMMVAAFGTYKKDIILAVPFVMQFWLLGSPVMYSLDRVPARYAGVYCLNPMVGLLGGFRDVLVRGVAPSAELVGIAAAVTVLVLAIGWLLFRHMAQFFADVL